MNRNLRVLATALTICLPALEARALQWPVEPVLAPPGIGTALGDWNSDSILHGGIDIPKPYLTTVKAAEDGCVVGVVDKFPGDPREQIGALFIAQTCTAAEGWSYVHVLNTHNLREGDIVVAGQEIGQIADFAPGNPQLDFFDHVHFSRFRPDAVVPIVDVPRNPLLFYQDNLPAQIAVLDSQKIFFVPDKTFDTAKFSFEGGKPIVFGNVDVVAEGHNKIVNETGAGVYSISYEVGNGPAGSGSIAERVLARFRQMTETSASSKFSLVYAPGSTDFAGRYVVSNSGASDPLLSDGVSNVIENAWFTRVRVGVDDSSGGVTASQMAPANIKAKFPDGTYSVIVRVGTFFDLNRTSQLKEVVVDNFRPFVTKISIGAESQYVKEWSFDGAKYVPAVPAGNKVLGPGSYPITLVFSEPVINPSLLIEGIGSLALTSDAPVGQQKTFTSTLNLDSVATEGPMVMMISATDMAGNQLLKITPTDTSIDPATQLTRDASGVMQGVGGTDASVRFIVSTATFVVFDSDDNIIPPGAVTGSSTIFVSGPAGTGAIALTGPVGFNPVIFTSTETALAEFDGLVDGSYVANAVDFNGVLLASAAFSVQIEPLIALLQDGTIPVDFGGTGFMPRMSVVATSVSTAIVQIGLSDANGPIVGSTRSFNAASATATYTDLANGYYTAVATDINGSTATTVFTIASPFPELTFSQNSVEIYDGVSGALDAIPTALLSPLPGETAAFSLSDVALLQTASVDSPQGPLFGPIQPGLGHVSGSFTPTLGTYIFRAEGQNGERTSASVQFVDLDVDIDPLNSVTAYDPHSDLFSADIWLKCRSTLGINHVEHTDAMGNEIGSLNCPGNLPVDASSAALVTLMSVDGDGNSFFTQIGLHGGGAGIGFGLFTPDLASPVSSGTIEGLTQVVPDPTRPEQSPGLTGNGSYITMIASVSLLRGGEITIDTNTLPFSFGLATGPILGSRSIFSGTATITSLTVSVSMSDGEGMELYNEDITYSTVTGLQIPATVKHFSNLGVFSTYRVTLHMTTPDVGVAADHCRQADEAGTTCLDGDAIIPYVGALGASIKGVTYNVFKGPLIGTDFAAGESVASADIGFGAKISNLNAVGGGGIEVALGRASPDPGYLSVPNNAAYSVFGSNNWPRGFSLTLPFNPAGLTPGQRSMLRVVSIDAVGNTGPDIPAQFGGSDVTFTPEGFGTFMIMAPIYPDPVKDQLGVMTVLHDRSTPVTIGVADTAQQPLHNMIVGERLVGQESFGPLYQLPHGLIFSPPALVSISVPPAALAAQNAPAAGQQLVEFSPETGMTMPLMTVLRGVPLTAQALISRTASVFGAFAPPAGGVAVHDVTPPVTNISFRGSASTATAGAAVISMTTSIDFAAVDPVVALDPISGLATTYFLLDQAYVSMSATPPNGFSHSFTLPIGTHTLTYFSVDKAGNVEAPNVSAITVNALPPGIAGLGLGVDGANMLWSISLDSGTVALAHNDRNGILTSSAVLSGADTAFPWTVFFDASGGAYAVGAAIGNNAADQLAVYKASTAGDAIVSSRTFDSGYNNNNLVFDAISPGWIVGAVQTQGPIDQSQQGERSYAAAIWRFDPTQGLVQLTTAYARAGMDIGTGIAVDAAGNLWVAGFSYSPNPRSTRAFDLAVWKYASDGKTLLAGPFIREGYLSDFNTLDLARVVVSNGVVYVSAPRGRGVGGTDTALVAFDAATGRVLAENAWRSGDGASTYPSTLLQDGAGHPVAAGSFDYGGTFAGIWRYGTDGSLLSVTQTNAGGAQGAAYNGTNLWLMVDGSSGPYLVASETQVAGTPADIAPPRTTFYVGDPSWPGSPVFIASTTLLGLSAVDDKFVLNDGLGVGTTQSFYAIDASAYGLYGSSFSVVAEGTHTISFYSLDLEGNADVARSSSVAIDLTSPVATLSAVGPTTFAIQAHDPVVNGAASGVAQTNYLIDASPESCQSVNSSTAAPHGTCANLSYAGAFALAVGTHTVYFQAVDNVGNGQDVILSSYVVVSGTASAGAYYALNPSTGPIGIPFSITGPGFGAYAGANTRVKFGTTLAPVSVWNDALISGTVPGLSTGIYSVAIERQNISSTTVLSAGTFAVLLPSATAISASSGPIGAPFSIAGTAFGPYAGALTRLLIGNTTAPVSVWNDTTISGTIPGLSTGTYPVQIQRATADGGLMTVSPFNVQVVAPSPTSFSPSSGPIGVPFSVSGSGFGPYAGTNTRIVFDGTRAPVSVWNDSTISGTIPNLPPGAHAVWIERASSDGGLSSSDTGYFTVTVPSVTAVSPSSGPIGATFSLAGQSFGPYAGSLTQLLIGGTTAPVSVWNDAAITATVPGNLLPGTYPVQAQRTTADGGLTASATAYFQVVAPFGASLTPSAGPIGVPFTVTGNGFGAYSGANTVLLIGGTTAALSVWNDTTISGTIPVLSTGTYPVVVERIQGTGMAASTVAAFTVTPLTLAVPVPSSGPIGVPFTITGSGFGPYAGANTRVLMGGTVVAVSVWNDTTISGTVPPIPDGSQPLWIERQTASGVQSSNTTYFLVTVPTVYSLAPSSAPIGSPFTIHGASFGPYAGTNTRVKFNGLVAPVSVWNDAIISGTVPGTVSTGAAVVLVERAAGAGLVQSATQAFLVLQPTITTMTPASGTAGTAVTLAGFGFGPYAGSATKLLVGGSTVAIAVWNDSTIRWTVPSSFTNGTYPVVVVRTPAGGTIQSDPVNFMVGTGVGALLAAAPLASRPDWHFQGDLILPAAEGGHIQTPSQAAVDVPPGALDQDTEVTLARDRNAFKADRAAALDRDRLGAGGEAISFGPEGTQFSRPVTIELPYDPALVPPGALANLAVHYYDPATKTWTPLATQADSVRHVLIAQTNHFSLYQPLGHGIGLMAADASFGFKAAYVFPNPVRGVSSVTIRAQPGQADSVEVRVYDLSGRKVHASSDFQLSTLDDGNGLGPQFTYDHAWDISGVGSGVYQYVITAKKSGQADIHKTGKLGVIK